MIVETTLSEPAVEHEGGEAESLIALGTDADDGDDATAGDGQPASSPGTLLYEGAQITEDVGMALALSMAMRHKLMLSAVGDLCKIAMFAPPYTG